MGSNSGSLQFWNAFYDFIRNRKALRITWNPLIATKNRGPHELEGSYRLPRCRLELIFFGFLSALPCSIMPYFQGLWVFTYPLRLSFTLLFHPQIHPQKRKRTGDIVSPVFFCVYLIERRWKPPPTPERPMPLWWRALVRKCNNFPSCPLRKRIVSDLPSVTHLTSGCSDSC